MPPNHNALWHATNYLRTLNAIKMHMSGYQFAATEPTLVFEFLDRFQLIFRGANLSETKAFSRIKEFLTGKDKALYNGAVLSNLATQLVWLDISRP